MAGRAARLCEENLSLLENSELVRAAAFCVVLILLVLLALALIRFGVGRVTGAAPVLEPDT